MDLKNHFIHVQSSECIILGGMDKPISNDSQYKIVTSKSPINPCLPMVATLYYPIYQSLAQVFAARQETDSKQHHILVALNLSIKGFIANPKLSFPNLQV